VFIATAYQNNPLEDMTCVDEGKDGKRISVAQEGGFGPKLSAARNDDNFITTLIAHWSYLV
jgi:hypothetical protein